MWTTLTPYRHSLALSTLAAALAVSATPASAQPRTRLVDCAAGSCLLVTGYRADPAAPVQINGRAVDVQGTRAWRATVPVETLRGWSAPYARSITIAVADEPVEAALPIGMFGGSERLADLTVTAK